MPTAITITGSRATGHRPLREYDAVFAEYLAPFAQEETHFYLGGANGIDSLALLWLATRTRSKISVAVPGTTAGQPPDACQAIATIQKSGRLSELVALRHASHPSTEAYHHRNRWMVDRSEFVIAFPHGEDEASGTWYTANYAAEQGKPRLIVPV
jgi:predicted Rossmann fold nucleotide-binding protein DprA/Smf involved in DNA uptake